MPIGQTHEDTLLDNLKKLKDHLHLEEASLKSVLERILRDIAGVYRGTGYRVVLEIPGTYGWSLLPEINKSNLEMMALLIEEIYPEARLCIDTGHLMTWLVVLPEMEKKKRIVELISLFKEYKKYIRMLHISSASSWASEFVDLYQYVHGKKPLWHVKGLDVMLPIDEEEQLHMIRLLRDLISGNDEAIEVCESRYAGYAVQDYFSQVAFDFGMKRDYYKEIVMQGSILGYVKKKSSTQGNVM